MKSTETLTTTSSALAGGTGTLGAVAAAPIAVGLPGLGVHRLCSRR